MRFTDKVAIVTGAGQGIGEAYAKALAREGAAVVIAEINETTSAAMTGSWRKLSVGPGWLICSPSTGVPSGFLPDRAKWKRAEKGTSTLSVEGLRMSRRNLVEYSVIQRSAWAITLLPRARRVPSRSGSTGSTIEKEWWEGAQGGSCSR